jgi:uncharacterized protein
MTENNINENASEENLNVQKENMDIEKIDGENTGREDISDDSTSRFQEFFAEAVEIQHSKMNNILLTFLELKKIDVELTEIEEEKGDLPEMIESIKSKVKYLGSQLEEKKQSLSQLEEEKAGLENENNSYEEKIGKYDEQKFNVRSNKEYDEIVKAIELLFDEVKKNETRIKEISESTGKFEADIETTESKVKELNTDLSEKQKHLDELNEQYEQDESALKEKREILISKLDSQNISLYERINNLYKGEATAVVRKGNCSGCYNSIPPQRVIEIKTAERVYTCQSCGRILISEELANS